MTSNWQSAKSSALPVAKAARRDRTMAAIRASLSEISRPAPELCTTLGIAREAQTAAAVLGRKFPDGRRYNDAVDVLKSRALEPSEDTTTWISRALR